MEGLASSEDFLFLMSDVGGGETRQKKEERTRESEPTPSMTSVHC